LPIGTRNLNGEALFCDIDSTFKTQKSEGAVCSNSFECTSNFCTNGVCVDIEGQLKETKSMLERVINWLSKLF